MTYANATSLQVQFQEIGERGVDTQDEHVHRVPQGHSVLAKRN
jgi:hypothetical protein